MKQTVAVMGFEPALQKTLEGLLSREPDLRLAGPTDPDVHTLILFPPSAEWVHQLRERYPRARLLAVMDWERRHQFVDTPIHDYVDTLLSYHGLLEVVRGDNPG
ncbi:MAG: hypothetical protein KF760_33385 [Candidatus Eremiobacteraeota bacterium]|nr:hypothetical protein [Candidatus Eremiobacteraeota bacterium]